MQKTKKKRNDNVEAMDVDENSSEVEQNGQDNEEATTSHNRNAANGVIDQIYDDEDGGVHVGDIYIPPPARPALTFEPTGPRLIITHIVNENFKSYAGVQTLGPFHKVNKNMMFVTFLLLFKDILF